MGPTAIGTAVWQGVDAHRRRPRSGSVSRQIAQQPRIRRCGAASTGPYPSGSAVGGGAAGPSGGTLLGVGLSGAELHELAASIGAGKPVALP